MSVLSAYFNKSVEQSSRYVDDLIRKVNYDEKGEEIITWEKCDYPSIVKENGNCKDWSLESLLKAGINPDFGIHTGYGTRLDGVDTLNSVISEVNSVLDEIEKSE